MVIQVSDQARTLLTVENGRLRLDSLPARREVAESPVFTLVWRWFRIWECYYVVTDQVKHLCVTCVRGHGTKVLVCVGAMRIPFNQASPDLVRAINIV
jgi:hypothetical protein